MKSMFIMFIYSNTIKTVQDKRRIFNKKKGDKLTRSMDDSSIDTVTKGPKMKRHPSETDLANDFLGVPPEKTK